MIKKTMRGHTPFTMGVENVASCRLPMPVDMATVLNDSSEVVNGIDAPDRSSESLLRYCPGPVVGKEKASQLVLWFKERSCEITLSVKAAEEKGNEVGSRSVEENSAKSQLIEWLPLP
jgi:hypothetical protein